MSHRSHDPHDRDDGNNAQYRSAKGGSASQLQAIQAALLSAANRRTKVLELERSLRELAPIEHTARENCAPIAHKAVVLDSHMAVEAPVAPAVATCERAPFELSKLPFRASRSLNLAPYCGTSSHNRDCVTCSHSGEEGDAGQLATSCASTQIAATQTAAVSAAPHSPSTCSPGRLSHSPARTRSAGSVQDTNASEAHTSNHDSLLLELLRLRGLVADYEDLIPDLHLQLQGARAAAAGAAAEAQRANAAVADMERRESERMNQHAAVCCLQAVAFPTVSFLTPSVTMVVLQERMEWVAATRCVEEEREFLWRELAVYKGFNMARGCTEETRRKFVHSSSTAQICDQHQLGAACEAVDSSSRLAMAGTHQIDQNGQRPVATGVPNSLAHELGNGSQEVSVPSSPEGPHTPKQAGMPAPQPHHPPAHPGRPEDPSLFSGRPGRPENFPTSRATHPRHAGRPIMPSDTLLGPTGNRSEEQAPSPVAGGARAAAANRNDGGLEVMVKDGDALDDSCRPEPLAAGALEQERGEGLERHSSLPPELERRWVRVGEGVTRCVCGWVKA